MTTPVHNFHARPVDALDEITRTLHAARARASSLNRELPNLARLREALQHWTTEATLDPNCRPSLESAREQLRVAVEQHAEAQAAQRVVDDLVARQATLQQQQRMRRIELANNALAMASEVYLNAGKALVKAYRVLLDQQRVSQSIPGAKVDIPAGFDFEPLLPPGWMGRTSDIMRDGNLPYENNERALAAELRAHATHAHATHIEETTA